MNKFHISGIALGIFVLIMFSSQSFAQSSNSIYDLMQQAQQLSSKLASQSQSQTLTIPQWIKNNAKYWSEGSISDSDFVKGIQYLIDNKILLVSNQDEIDQLKNENLDLTLQKSSLQSQLTQLQEYQAKTNAENAKPRTTIYNGTVNWDFSDSKGNRYSWTMPMATYDRDVLANAYYSTLLPSYNLKLPNGNMVQTYDLHQLATSLSQGREFSKVVDEMYDNAGSDDQFIYEVWYLVAQMTTYNKDITNTNLLPLETLTRGEGDCKDKSILIADLLRSSSHTSNWDIHLVIMDSNNPTNPQTVNHMIVHVDTGKSQYNIEATATPDNNGLSFWKGDITGWNVPF